MEAEREQAGRPFRERPGGRAFLSLPSKAVPKRRRTTGVPIAVVLRVSKALSRLPTGPLAHRACYYSALICDERNRLDFTRFFCGTSWALFLFWVLCSAAVVTIADWYQPPHLRSNYKSSLGHHGIGRLVVGPGVRLSPADQRQGYVKQQVAICSFFVESSRVLLFRFMMSTKSSILQYLTHPHIHIRSPSVFHITQQKRSTGRSPSLRPRRGTRP